MNNKKGKPDFFVGLEMVEFFSKKYQERQNITERTGYLEDENFWALREIELQKREAVEDGKPLEYDFSKENVGFTKTKPIPYDILYAYIVSHIEQLMEAKFKFLIGMGKPLCSSKNDEEDSL